MADPEMTMEVPEQVREFGERSVDQAEKAVSAFVDMASKSLSMVPGPMNDFAKQALAITQKNITASFDHARKLMQAKDINEVMQLQSEFLRSQFNVATEQLKQYGGDVAAAVGETMKERSDLI